MNIKEVKTRNIHFELSVEEAVKLYHAIINHSQQEKIEEDIIEELGGILTSGDLKII